MITSRRRIPFAVVAAVEQLEPRAMLAATATQTALEQIQATGAVAFLATVGGSTRQQVIAVLDTGVTASSLPAGSLWVNPREVPGDGIDNDGNGFKDDVSGWDFASGDNDPTDQHGHGTKVAGVILAVDPQVKILPIRLGDASITDSNMLAGIRYVEELRNSGVQIVAANMSFGGGAYNSSIADLIAKSRVVYVGAGGNQSRLVDGVSSFFYPASYQHVASVAANTTGSTARASYSNYGNGLQFNSAGNWLVKGMNGRLVTFAGTSAAAPSVAGSVSLAWRANVVATRAQVIAAFQQTATASGFTQWGLVDVNGAARNLYALRAA